VLGGVSDHEVGSASSVLQAMQQLGMSLGIAGIGTLFFALLDPDAQLPSYLHAAEWTTLGTGALIAAALALASLLPRRAREQETASAVAVVA
jgi:hypothetical protein